MAQIIDGKQISQQLREGMKQEVAELIEQGIKPCLAVIIVGEDPASKVYVRNKERACKQLGMDSILLRLPEETSQQELLERVRALNSDPAVNGILVQLPLPKHLDEQEVLREISPEKDVDGFHALNAGRLLLGEQCTVACTPAGCLELIRSTGVNISGAEAVVVGRSNIVDVYKRQVIGMARPVLTLTAAYLSYKACSAAAQALGGVQLGGLCEGIGRVLRTLMIAVLGAAAIAIMLLGALNASARTLFAA